VPVVPAEAVPAEGCVKLARQFLLFGLRRGYAHGQFINKNASAVFVEREWVSRGDGEG
jgi:hypothetical protein